VKKRFLTNPQATKRENSFPLGPLYVVANLYVIRCVAAAVGTIFLSSSSTFPPAYAGLYFLFT